MISVDELAFAIDGLNLDAETQEVLEDVLTAIVQQVLDDSLTGALPSLPIPGFALPASVSDLGFRRERFAAVSTFFSTTSSHALLRETWGFANEILIDQDCDLLSLACSLLACGAGDSPASVESEPRSRSRHPARSWYRPGQSLTLEVWKRRLSC